MGRTTLLLTACITTLVAASAVADIYRWRDEQGNIHFSDEPRDGAERYDPGQPTVVDALPTPSNTRRPDERESVSDGAPEPVNYERFRITSPDNEAQIRGNPGNVTVRLAAEPRLQPNHRVDLRIDGNPAPNSPARSLEFTLRGVPRGEHRLRASIVDQEGNVLAEAGQVTFYMFRPSVNLPARQGN